MKAAVITFPGSNCDDDCSFVLERVCGWKVDRLFHKAVTPLTSYDLVVLPGGFSYGDYLRSGAIAAVSPIMDQVKRYAQSGGLVLGICNGFQMLCELRLLPGALAANQKLRFVCRDTKLRVESDQSLWTALYKDKEILTLPIAHGDGRYVVDSNELGELKKKSQILFCYDGENPNGSESGIAGICNEQKNVLGMMPHPERATDLRSKDGERLWLSIAKHVQERVV